MKPLPFGAESPVESRRQFLAQLATASTAALMAGEPSLLSAAPSGEKIEHPLATADACILL